MQTTDTDFSAIAVLDHGIGTLPGIWHTRRFPVNVLVKMSTRIVVSTESPAMR
jgi:hypothetical protein